MLSNFSNSLFNIFLLFALQHCLTFYTEGLSGDFLDMAHEPLLLNYSCSFLFSLFFWVPFSFWLFLLHLHFHLPRSFLYLLLLLPLMLSLLLSNLQTTSILTRLSHFFHSYKPLLSLCPPPNSIVVPQNHTSFFVHTSSFCSKIHILPSLCSSSLLYRCAKIRFLFLRSLCLPCKALVVC